jgi:hypothetical protein
MLLLAVDFQPLMEMFITLLYLTQLPLRKVAIYTNFNLLILFIKILKEHFFIVCLSNVIVLEVF